MVSKKILVSILVVLLNTWLAGAATLNVGPGQTYTTIQSAVDSANTGDVISVGEGTYPENVIIKKNGISITGVNKEKTVIDGKKTGSGIKIESNNIKISTLTVQNSGGSGKEDAGISLYRANNNLITDVILVNNIVGISMNSGSNNNVASSNDIRSSSKYGVLIFSSNDNQFNNNNIQGNKFGIYGDTARTNHIYSNNFIDNTDQAFDNSGMNSWDDGKSGNYWSTYKGSGAFPILGQGNAMDNYPLSKAVSIKYEAAPTEGQKTQESGKSTPGFTAIAVLGAFITIVVLRKIRV